MALGASVSVAAVSAAQADGHGITVAYFLEWPMPFQYAKAEGLYDEALGVPLNWVSFESGVKMSAAMASGDVQIAYSQGLVPFVLAVNKGLPITLVGIAVSYAENDNCVVHQDSGITKANAKMLEGKKVATPLGNVTHYKLLRSLEHLGVDANKVRMIPMNTAEGAAALARGDVTMACGFGGGLTRMKEYGDVLLTAKEQEDIGIRVFDVISVTNDFAQRHPELVKKFLQVTEDANQQYLRHPSRYHDVIAKAAGMDSADAINMLGNFIFPSADEQRSSDWMGGTVQRFTKEVADFYVAQGTIPESLPDYSHTVDARFLADVK